ncbi:hypothetical protein ABBZ21_19855 [Acinetobacter baumannii]|uniref:hypothetical protein n=1 Tax=Acinetobacter baumannii TaxID=470 RepID=UPI00385FF704
MTKLLDTKVCVLIYEGIEKCAYRTVEECSNAIFKEDPAELLNYDWKVVTFRDWILLHKRLGYLGEPTIEAY